MFLALFSTVLFAAASPVPTPIDASLADVLCENVTQSLVRVEGNVVDAFREEPDTRYVRLFLHDGHDLLTVALQTENPLPPFSRLRNAHVRVTGFVTRSQPFWRKFAKPLINQVSQLEILDSKPNDPFAAPVLDERKSSGAESVPHLANRQVVGTVRACWQENHLLLELKSGQRIVVQLASEQILPHVGSCIQVTGLTDTDTVHFLLVFAIWRPADRSPAAEAQPIAITAASLSRYTVCSELDGKCVTVSGVVHGTPNTEDKTGALLLKCGPHTLKLDGGTCENSLQSLEIGSTVSVTGIFLAEVDPWSLFTSFARVKDFTIVLRNPLDLHIVSRPSWWTPRRLLMVIVALFLALVGILVWNRMLQRLAHRRGHELAEAQLASAESDLKFSERTRLAVELHDSLSQTLTGAAMEVRAAETVCDDRNAGLKAHLATAGKTLQSCRDELKNCLWDLRNQSLEEKDLTAAILKTLQPHINESHLTVRFNVSRSKLSDNTTYAILRVVRELVLNAIRHGQASAVRIAGCIDGDRICFSVEDNGSGFDPDTCPGVLQGHFGIQGIRERLRALNGGLSLESEVGHGTRATVFIRLAEGDKKT